MTKAIKITSDKVVEEIEVEDYRDMQAVVEGLIEAVELSDGSTMYVNEEFLFQFGPDRYNSIATDVAGLGGRMDLLMRGILGNVLIVGPVDDEGYDTDVTDKARRWVKMVAREA